MNNNNDITTISLGAVTPDLLPSLTTIDLSTLSNISVGATGSSASDWLSASPNAVWTTTATSTIGSVLGGAAMGVSQSGKVSVFGENADVEINGKSMKEWMERVEERLNILTPNPELEKEWDDLRRLGERYRKLEKKCKEKAEVWKKLKAMPPPKI